MKRSILTALAVLALGVAGPAAADNAGVHRRGGALEADGGEAVYAQICQGCHMPDGRGAVGAGHYPAFAGNPTMVSAGYVAATVLFGRHDMPSFAQQPGDSDGFFIPATLSDAQIADVVNYVRTHFGNHYPDRLSEADVKALRQGHP